MAAEAADVRVEISGGADNDPSRFKVDVFDGRAKLTRIQTSFTKLSGKTILIKNGMAAVGISLIPNKKKALLSSGETGVDLSGIFNFLINNLGVQNVIFKSSKSKKGVVYGFENFKSQVSQAKVLPNVRIIDEHGTALHTPPPGGDVHVGAAAHVGAGGDGAPVVADAAHVGAGGDGGVDPDAAAPPRADAARPEEEAARPEEEAAPPEEEAARPEEEAAPPEEEAAPPEEEAAPPEEEAAPPEEEAAPPAPAAGITPQYQHMIENAAAHAGSKQEFLKRVGVSFTPDRQAVKSLPTTERQEVQASILRNIGVF